MVLVSLHFMLGLVVICRDGEGNLGRLLNTGKGLVDKMVVMDTGFVDRTVEVASKCGARVGQMIWPDDFSAARNAALDLAAADWPLGLDADEWLIDGRGFLQQLRHTPPNFVRQVLLEDQGASDSANEGTTRNWLSRLLPGNVRYQGRIHEQPVHQLPVRRTPLSVGPDSYSPAALAAKRGRNRRLLEAEMLDHPGDPYLLYQLGKDADVYQDYALAADSFSAARQRMNRSHPRLDDLRTPLQAAMLLRKAENSWRRWLAIGEPLYASVTTGRASKRNSRSTAFLHILPSALLGPVECRPLTFRKKTSSIFRHRYFVQTCR
jgi:glycosyltransferase involved in cell wall biosynthesis